VSRRFTDAENLTDANNRRDVSICNVAYAWRWARKGGRTRNNYRMAAMVD